MCKKVDPTQALTCIACTDGYYDSGTGTVTCTACGANCATCTQAGDDKCDTCKPGYFKQGDLPGTCTPCADTASGIEGCATCTFSGSLTCNSCKANYRQSGSSPITCTRACEDETACGVVQGRRSRRQGGIPLLLLAVRGPDYVPHQRSMHKGQR
ncbi:Hypothetical protein GL50581_780 [Giardia duodenalis ATCC 50581]|uniref:Variant-specific surface protein n=1 Tax=Giardia intestinalis (strain ATCC 50581 / GS clone H7) TaxID=598745 RepID=C6LPW0_GIAIB|nr:Hypothetical protein GL50581_780 [Giardia intestinalis ATCC 50581]